MHREHSVEHLRRDEIVMRTYELDTHDRRFHSSADEKYQRVKDVQDAQSLVIDGGHPLVKPVHERARRRLGNGPRDGFGRHQRRVSKYAVTAFSSGSLNPMAGILHPGLMTLGS